jgi:hypothetical protein
MEGGLKGMMYVVQVRMIVPTDQANFVASLGISSHSNEIQTLAVWHA